MLHVQNDLPFKSHFFLKRNFVTESLSPLVLLPLEMAFRLTCSQDFATRIEEGWAKKYFLESPIADFSKLETFEPDFDYQY